MGRVKYVLRLLRSFVVGRDISGSREVRAASAAWSSGGEPGERPSAV